VVIITKQALSRRTVLRGLGVSLALPLLDGMVPALTALAKTAAAPKLRLGFIYVGQGAALAHWTPAAEGKGFEFTPGLAPLAGHRDHLLVLTGLDHKPAETLPGEPGAGHGRCGGAWLTGVHAKPTEGGDFRAGISVDQIAAQHAGAETQLPSLELCIESNELSGSCDAGYSCVYTNTLCWRGPTMPLPMENNPRALFERLFGDSGSTNPAVRLVHVKRQRSILDSVIDKVGDLERRLAPSDRVKVEGYLASVRDVELRLQKAEAQVTRELPEIERPAGIPETFEEHTRLMFDLQVLAYQTDLTRVITFMLSKELSSMTYPQIGVPEPYHPISHHRDDAELLLKQSKVNAYHAAQFAYYLDKLKSTPDGDGSLLDQVLVMYGSGMGNSNLHDPHNLPILLAGGPASSIGWGRHLRYPEKTPLTNLYLTMLHRAGVPVEQVGDSTGQLQHLIDL
jgi:hypothetical protein